MRCIVFDIDGTLTDFNQYVIKYALPYFRKHYGMEIVFKNKLELEDVFDMPQFFSKKYGCGALEANDITKAAVNKYWHNTFRFLRFTFLPFRKNAASFIRDLKKQGFSVEFHTSRAFSSQNGCKGKIVRIFTYLQLLFNGILVPYSKLNFYDTDQSKIEGIIKIHPEIVFDDKCEIIYQLTKESIRTVCVRGAHNASLIKNNYTSVLDAFSKEEINSALSNLMDKKIELRNRIKKSDKFYNSIHILRFVILKIFKPIILHEENVNIDTSRGVVVAPNHQSTLDPLIITSILDRNIHWAALKRFFDAEDSIFNNNKNAILCKITAAVFKKLEYFPIERTCDNPNANNMRSIRNMVAFLKEAQIIGIFPEGTTNKTAKDFGDFHPGFIYCAKKNNSKIVPITVLWCKQYKNKLIVNFGKEILTNNLTKTELYDQYLSIQKIQLEENKTFLREKFER